MDKPGLTILTPAYNRRNRIDKLYDSLCRQTENDFQWLVIDDGSTDALDEYIAGLSGYTFRLDYYKKPNGGKHTALNFSHDYIRSDMVAIVDSDDYLTDDAVETILEYWDRYKNDEQIGGITFLRSAYLKNTFPRRKLSDCTDQRLYPEDGIVDYYYRVKTNRNLIGGSFDIIKTSVLKRFPFPEYPGEKFVGDSYLWNMIGYDYKTVFLIKRYMFMRFSATE